MTTCRCEVQPDPLSDSVMRVDSMPSPSGDCDTMTNPATRCALVIGNSDGIGRAFTDSLLTEGWQVTGLSRSDLVRAGDYRHFICDVTSCGYPAQLEQLWNDRGPFDLIAHCVGVGSGLDECGFGNEAHTVQTNLVSLVQLADILIPLMHERRAGHLIGLSSIADDLHLAEAPSYSASKAGYSNYLRSLAFHLRKSGIAVTNIRFGFVDTKMAKGKSKPLIITPARAATVMMDCIRTRPMQLTYPKTAGLLVHVVRWLQNLRVWTARG